MNCKPFEETNPSDENDDSRTQNQFAYNVHAIAILDIINVFRYVKMYCPLYKIYSEYELLFGLIFNQILCCKFSLDSHWNGDSTLASYHILCLAKLLN